jgi:hypothetical protein
MHIGLLFGFGAASHGAAASTANAKLLPLAVSLADWNSFTSTGRSPDGSVHDSHTLDRPTSDLTPPNNVRSGGDNVPELIVEPDWCCVGRPTNNTPTMREWIDNGASPSDMAYFGPNGLQTPANCSDVPGTKHTLMRNLQNAAGQPRTVLLYDTYRGGNYHVVGFAGVTIVGTAGNGSHQTVALQPTLVIDPAATTSGTSWNGGTKSVGPASPLSLVR